MTLNDLIKRLLNLRAEELPLVTGGAALFFLLAANLFEHVGGLAPCKLCYDQRYIYWAVAGFSALTWLFLRLAMTRDTLVPRLASLLIVAALAFEFFVAAYHTGVEQGWWKGPATCTRSGGAMDLSEILQQTNIVLCDDIPWSLFGISMAGYNAIGAFLLTLYAARTVFTHFTTR